MRYDFLKKRSWWLLFFSLMAENSYSIAPNYVVPPDPIQAYTLQSGDTLTVSPGVNLNVAGPVVTLLGNNTVTNSGTIQPTNNTTTIVAGSNSAGLMMINNYGAINGISNSAPAIDLTGVTSNNIQINTYAGSTIGGQILLSGSTDSVITVAGGTIQGLMQKNLGIGTASLNINNTFGTSNVINQIDNINVSNNGTAFTISNNIGAFTNFTVNNGTQAFMVNNSVVSGNTLNNLGTFQINSGNLATTTINNGGNFVLLGGTFSGTMVGTSPSSTLTLQNNFSTASPIMNVNTINVLAGNFTINNPITGFNVLYNQSTINLNGGSVGGAITPLGSTSTINVNTDYSTLGPMGARDINVNAGLFQVNNPLTVTGGLTIASPAEMALNNTVNGAVTNSGIISLNSLQAITGNFTQTSSGSFETTLGGTTPGSYGALLVGGNANIAGTIDVILPNNQAVTLPNNSTFDIVTLSGTGTLSNSATVTQPTSSVLSYSLSTPTANILRLTLMRRMYAFANTIPAWNGVAGALDQIRVQNPTTAQLNVLSTLDSIGSQTSFESALSQLSPFLQRGAILTNIQTQKWNFDKIFTRMNGLQASLDNDKNWEVYRIGPSGGYMAGECGACENPYRDQFMVAPLARGGGGPMFFANSINVPTREGVPGFVSITGGIGAILDYPINCYSKIGGFASYAASSVKDNERFGNSIYINNGQGGLYGRLEYQWLFFDGIVAMGGNNYKSTRNIRFLTAAATANYRGTQRAAKIRGGAAIPIWNLEVTPFASVQYTQLRLHPFLEQGAVGANLSYPGSRINTVEQGIGLRLADITEAERFLPEVHVILLHYTKAPNLVVTSRFVDGGPSFVTTAPIFANNGYNVGGSVSAVLSSSLILIGTYDYEGRKNYNSHSVSLKVRRYF